MDADQYRRYAKACFKLASVMTDINMRITMLEVARGWMRLAEQNERNSAGAYDAENKIKLASWSKAS